MTAPGFRPLPLFANPHVQTVLSVCLKGGRLPGRTQQHVVALDDGDRLVLHENTPRSWQPGHPVAVVLHGLTGSHRSGGVVLQARRLFERGARTFRLDLRGAGAGFHLARGTYNAGCTDDLRAALAVVERLAPESPLVVVGTSLGGNIVLKLAGEGCSPRLTRVAALNPPIDLHACVARLSRPENRFYEWHFLTGLISSARRRARLFADASLPEFRRGMRLKDFDDVYTAPRAGYSGVEEYYTRASSGPGIASIQVPTLILTARDDPFIAVEPFEQLAQSAHVDVRIANHGGHTGFLGPDGRGGIGWAETKLAEWLLT